MPKKVLETKPFYLSSEFYVLIGAGIQTVINGAHDPKSLILNGIAAIYAISRGLAKSGVSHTTGQ